MSELRQREPRIEITFLTKRAPRIAPACTFSIPGVTHTRDETLVWCHSNEERHGKGIGLKAHDFFGAIGCQACHDWYDIESRRNAQPAGSYLEAVQRVRDDEVRRMVFDAAFIKTLIWLHQNGYVSYGGE